MTQNHTHTQNPTKSQMTRNDTNALRRILYDFLCISHFQWKHHKKIPARFARRILFVFPLCFQRTHPNIFLAWSSAAVVLAP